MTHPFWQYRRLHLEIVTQCFHWSALACLSDSLKNRWQIPPRLHQSLETFHLGPTWVYVWVRYTETEGKKIVKGGKQRQAQSCIWEEAAWCESGGLDDGLVEGVQVRRLQFLCSDWSHSLRTYCCSAPQLLALLPALLPPPTCLVLLHFFPPTST